jgi:hypothetical protein
MKYPTLVQRAVDQIIHHYAEYDRLAEQYILDMDDVPDHDLFELTALLMQEEPERASEATGPDNPQYLSIMLPALIDYMKDITDLDNQFIYIYNWEKGILSYHREHIKELLDSQLEIYNAERAA